MLFPGHDMATASRTHSSYSDWQKTKPASQAAPIGLSGLQANKRKRLDVGRGRLDVPAGSGSGELGMDLIMMHSLHVWKSPHGQGNFGNFIQCFHTLDLFCFRQGLLI